MPLSLMHCHFEAEDLALESAPARPPSRRGTGAVPAWLAFMAVFSIMFAAVTSRVGAATFGVTTPGQQTLTNRFLPYAGSGTQLIGNSPAWRDSAGVLGINNYLEGLETLTPGAAVNLNFSTWRTKRITLNQNTVFTAINIPSTSTNVQTMLLEVIGDGAFTVSFANVTWQTPEITTPEAGVVTLYALRGDSGAVKGYTQAVTATGIGPLTVGYVPLANATNNLTDSVMSQTGSTVTWEDTGTPYASLSLDGGFFPTLTLQAPAGFSHLVTPGALDVDTQGASAVWRFNGLALQPQAAGSVIGSTTVPLSAIYAYNLIWGDGGAGANAVADSFGNGAPEGVHAAGVGSVYRNTNGVPGTVLYVKESGGAGNTGWKAALTAGTVTESFGIACSDETTPLTTGTAKVTFRMPYAFTVTAVRASLTTAQASGNIFTVDINEGASSILSTKITIDNTETTSVTAVTAPVISDSALADDASMTIDIDQLGNGSATGLKVWIIGHQ